MDDKKVLSNKYDFLKSEENLICLIFIVFFLNPYQMSQLSQVTVEFIWKISKADPSQFVWNVFFFYNENMGIAHEREKKHAMDRCDLTA